MIPECFKCASCTLDRDCFNASKVYLSVSFLRHLGVANLKQCLEEVWIVCPEGEAKEMQGRNLKQQAMQLQACARSATINFTPRPRQLPS